MILKLLIEITFLLLSSGVLAEAAAPIAKPNCPESCGNVSIPYPFGIGHGCFYNEWFEITCNTSSFPRPFLKRINLEVLTITLEGKLHLNNPIIFSPNCGGGTTNLSVSLEGSPFVFSQPDNSFTAVGCNNLATISNNGAGFVGCRSRCFGNSSLQDRWERPYCRNGSFCCEAVIPPNLEIFRATLDSIDPNAGTMDCTSALIVDKNWFRNLKDPPLVQNMDHVPVVVDWGVFNTKYYPYSSNNNFDCAEVQTLRTIVRCLCSPGYEGNPHLPHGCQDIDECARPNQCNGMMCVNQPGRFECQPYTRDTKMKNFIIGICSAIGGILILIAIWFLYGVIKKRKEAKLKKRFFKRNGGLLLEQQLHQNHGNIEEATRLFGSDDLDKATDHFNNNRIVGRGGQGTVYKGMLTDGRIIAVKKSRVMEESEVGHFINEVAILSQINHRNIVKLFGCCLETEVPLLVYEFIPNGTLFQYVHDPNEEVFLSWEIRMRIATEVAGALAYLHSSASMPIYHRDVKSTNILLDEKFRAKVADFGTSRSVSVDQTHLTTQVKGTFGYLDPEYFQSSQFTDKSDVYSFGVVLVELLTGQKAISFTRAEEGRSLATYFLNSMADDRLREILDARIRKEENMIEIQGVANLAMRCLSLNGKMRPTMKEVALELEDIRVLRGVSKEKKSHEVEYIRTEIIEHWDAEDTTTSTTGSFFK